jgi:hypothetical protein
MPISVASGEEITDKNYIELFDNLDRPQEIPDGSIRDPTKVLTEIIGNQDIIETTTLKVTAAIESEGVLNIPFLTPNAQVRFLESTFYIEKVKQPIGAVALTDTFMQLQYKQKVMLRFDGIDWPHISVGTLIRQ